MTTEDKPHEKEDPPTLREDTEASDSQSAADDNNPMTTEAKTDSDTEPTSSSSTDDGDDDNVEHTSCTNGIQEGDSEISTVSTSAAGLFVSDDSSNNYGKAIANPTDENTSTSLVQTTTARAPALVTGVVNDRQPVATATGVASSRPDGPALTRLTRSNATIMPTGRSHPGAFHVGGPQMTLNVATGQIPNDDNSNEAQGCHHIDELEQQGSGTTETTMDNSSHRHAFDAELVTSPANHNNNDASEPSYEQPSSSATVVFVEGRYITDDDEQQRMGAAGRFLLLSSVGILLLICIIIALSLGLSGFFEEDKQTQGSSADTSAGTSSPGKPTVPVSDNVDGGDKQTQSTLELIKNRGSLRAGVLEGFYDPFDVDENGVSRRFYPRLTHAVAAGILGPESKVDFISMDLQELFPSLANGTIDIILFGATHTMERDVYMASSTVRFSFSVPYHYAGIGIGGDPLYVNCVDNHFEHLGECIDLKVCVTAGDSKSKNVIAEYLPERYIRAIDWSDGGIYRGLITGECNVIVEDVGLLMESIIPSIEWNGSSYTGDYSLGQTVLSNDPLTAVSRQDDPEFSNFINVVLLGLLAAESHNITQAKAETMPQTDVFGEEYKDLFRHAVATVGNYAEIYIPKRGPNISRNRLNFINNGSTGLLYPHPFGNFESQRDETPLGKTLSAILQRGRLHCGVRMDRTGFATQLESGLAGMEIDFCRALSASLFRGDGMAVDFVEIEEARDGFVLLSTDTIDVLAGATMSLQNSVREPTTLLSYSFSPPYFYGFSPVEDNFCLATRQDDQDWARFVYWVTTASFYAEMENIVAATSNDMPEVFLYGQKMKRMFRDAILAVGNYAEMYERNLQEFIPRGGRNVLNTVPNTGPQHYVVPGIF